MIMECFNDKKKMEPIDDSKDRFIKQFLKDMEIINQRKEEQMEFVSEYNKWSKEFMEKFETFVNIVQESFSLIKPTNFQCFCATVLVIFYAVEGIRCDNYKVGLASQIFNAFLLLMSIITLIAMTISSHVDRSIRKAKDYCVHVSNLMEHLDAKLCLACEKFNLNYGPFPIENAIPRTEQPVLSNWKFCINLITRLCASWYKVYGVLFALKLSLIMFTFDLENYLSLMDIVAIFLMLLVALLQDLKIMKTCRKIKTEKAQLKLISSKFFQWFENEYVLKKSINLQDFNMKIFWEILERDYDIPPSMFSQLLLIYETILVTVTNSLEESVHSENLYDIINFLFFTKTDLLTSGKCQTVPHRKNLKFIIRTETKTPSSRKLSAVKRLPITDDIHLSVYFENQDSPLDKSFKSENAVQKRKDIGTDISVQEIGEESFESTIKENLNSEFKTDEEIKRDEYPNTDKEALEKLNTPNKDFCNGGDSSDAAIKENLNSEFKTDDEVKRNEYPSTDREVLGRLNTPDENCCDESEENSREIQNTASYCFYEYSNGIIYQNDSQIQNKNTSELTLFHENDNQSSTITSSPTIVNGKAKTRHRRKIHNKLENITKTKEEVSDNQSITNSDITSKKAPYNKSSNLRSLQVSGEAHSPEFVKDLGTSTDGSIISKGIISEVKSCRTATSIKETGGETPKELTTKVLSPDNSECLGESTENTNKRHSISEYALLSCETEKGTIQSEVRDSEKNIFQSNISNNTFIKSSDEALNVVSYDDYAAFNRISKCDHQFQSGNVSSSSFINENDKKENGFSCPSMTVVENAHSELNGLKTSKSVDTVNKLIGGINGNQSFDNEEKSPPEEDCKPSIKLYCDASEDAQILDKQQNGSRTTNDDCEIKTHKKDINSSTNLRSASWKDSHNADNPQNGSYETNEEATNDFIKGINGNQRFDNEEKAPSKEDGKPSTKLYCDASEDAQISDKQQKGSPATKDDGEITSHEKDVNLLTNLSSVTSKDSRNADNAQNDSYETKEKTTNYFMEGINGNQRFDNEEKTTSKKDCKSSAKLYADASEDARIVEKLKNGSLATKDDDEIKSHKKDVNSLTNHSSASSKDYLNENNLQNGSYETNEKTTNNFIEGINSNQRFDNEVKASLKKDCKSSKKLYSEALKDVQIVDRQLNGSRAIDDDDEIKTPEKDVNSNLSSAASKDSLNGDNLQNRSYETNGETVHNFYKETTVNKIFENEEKKSANKGFKSSTIVVFDASKGDLIPTNLQSECHCTNDDKDTYSNGKYNEEKKSANKGFKSSTTVVFDASKGDLIPTNLQSECHWTNDDKDTYSNGKYSQSSTNLSFHASRDVLPTDNLQNGSYGSNEDKENELWEKDLSQLTNETLTSKEVLIADSPLNERHVTNGDKEIESCEKDSDASINVDSDAPIADNSHKRRYETNEEKGQKPSGKDFNSSGNLGSYSSKDTLTAGNLINGNLKENDNKEMKSPETDFNPLPKLSSVESIRALTGNPQNETVSARLNYSVRNHSRTNYSAHGGTNRVSTGKRSHSYSSCDALDRDTYRDIPVYSTDESDDEEDPKHDEMDWNSGLLTKTENRNTDYKDTDDDISYTVASANNSSLKNLGYSLNFSNLNMRVLRDFPFVTIKFTHEEPNESVQTIGDISNKTVTDTLKKIPSISSQTNSTNSKAPVDLHGSSPNANTSKTSNELVFKSSWEYQGKKYLSHFHQREEADTDTQTEEVVRKSCIGKDKDNETVDNDLCRALSSISISEENDTKFDRDLSNSKNITFASKDIQFCYKPQSQAGKLKLNFEQNFTDSKLIFKSKSKELLLKFGDNP